MGNSESRAADSDLEEIQRKNELFSEQNRLLRERLELLEKTKALQQPKASVSSAMPTATTLKKTVSPTELPSSMVGASASGSEHPKTSERLDKLKTLDICGMKFRILKLLGIGGFSKVYECLDPNNELRAVKCIDYDGSDKSTLDIYTKEVKLLQALRHTGKVIKIYVAKHVPEDKKLYCVMERGDTDLDAYFKKGKVDKLKMKFYWKEMLLAVKALHDNNIVHADLKPANFVLVGGALKLIDLGLSRVIRQDMTNITCDGVAGTVDYMSPESFKSRDDGKIKIGTYSDVWSLGCMLYAMLFGRTPFQHIPLIGLKLMAIGDPAFSIPIPSTGVEDRVVIDVLKKCLQRNAHNRASIGELLEHEYLTENADMLGLMLAAGLAKAMSERTTNSD